MTTAIETTERHVQTGTWILDKEHAKLGFTIKHLLISEVDGLFTDFDLKLIVNKEDLSDAQVEVEAKIASINTANEKRDTHLRSVDFFDADKHPVLRFKSSSIVKQPKGDFTLTGALDIHGIAKEIVLRLEYGGTAKHPYTGQTIAGFRVSGTVNRLDFEIAKETPKIVLSNEVEIKASIELIKS